ncbi:MAG: asparagine synthase (glutamine-hydrolyzing) [Pseudomonadota bacterium]
MCGIAGMIVPNRSGIDLAGGLTVMTDALSRRGPDGAGHWTGSDESEEYRLGLAHTRLSIQDVSNLGAQPMTSPSGEWVVSFNGEIYNFHMLRDSLLSDGVRFRGHSDTEVLVALLDRFGLPETLKRLDGMFALAAYSKGTRRLYLARDRVGEKPLYYGTTGSCFVFGSTLAPIVDLPFWQGEIDRQAVGLYLRYRYVPTPYSIYEGIRKLPAAHYLEIDTRRPLEDTPPVRYWSLPESAPQSREPVDPVDGLQSVLSQVVSEQLISDRSLGAFLSGGIDSSLITAMMCEQASQRVKTFTVAFEEPEYNEGDFAKRIANHLGTDHTEAVFPARACLDAVTDLPAAFDEPFADASQLPMMLVARVARQSVVVALSGDGGDESFAGYDRYYRCLEDWRRIAAMPAVLRGATSSAAKLAAKPPTELLATALLRAIGRLGRGRRARSIFGRIAQQYGATDIVTLYHYYLAMSRTSVPVVDHQDVWLPDEVFRSVTSDLRKMMSMDTAYYLPDDILVKVDRATMFVGLESRAPLLDRRILEFAWSLSDDAVVGDDGRGKAPLRALLDTKVPRALTDRPKRGFAVPLAAWLRKDLRSWAEDLLTPERLAATGVFDVSEVRLRWRQHLDRVWDNSELIWSVLQFQAWAQEAQP